MSRITFDPDARTEFLAAIEYYEECQHGLGRRFRLLVESAVSGICLNPLIHNLFIDSFGKYPRERSRSTSSIIQIILPGENFGCGKMGNDSDTDPNPDYNKDQPL